MTAPTLIVITGPPAAGKSTLARWLAGRLGWPLLAKDDFKERLFGEFGTGDRAWSRQLSDRAWTQLFDAATRQLEAGTSLLLEGNFRAGEHEARLVALAQSAGARLVQVHCTAPAAALAARLDGRARHGRRHPGHLDRELLNEALQSTATASRGPLAFGDPTLTFDSARGNQAARQSLLAALLHPGDGG